MKKKVFSFLTICLTLLMAMTSCQKDPAELILGRWKMDVDLSTNHEILTSEDENFDETYSMREGGVDSAFFTFDADGKVKIESYYIGETGSDVEVLSYSLEDGMLKLGEEEQYTIATLDSENLVLDAQGTISDAVDHYEWFVHFVLRKEKE